MDITDINKQLTEMLKLSPLEIEEGIEKLSDESGKTKTILNKQFSELQKENRLDNENETKNLPSDNLGSKIGNAFDKKDLAEHIIEVQPCFYDRSRNWWLWNWPETKWERVDETDILNAIDKQATINTINSKEKNEMLEALKQVSRLNAPMPIKPTWIQFKNIIVDIETGEKFRAKPDYFVTNPIPWEMDEEGFF